MRKLHGDWRANRDESLLVQINNLRTRLLLIRWMQLLGALSLLFCVVSMMLIHVGEQSVAQWLFMTAVGLMALSLASLVIEVTISGGALRILLRQVEDEAKGE